ncbi:hypothetical protein DENSPDRAFT_843320 [Dentipellis sp. KUC8613]|nr:hypothetical protein DENSPDRAFT_842115 [Dentipellis sp. KUC8613]KAA1476376.1 hypothetical protein DENSPDRAFT_843320 [Dentipellis sp. KUC8613]
MSFHPYAAARDHRASPPARRTSNPTGYSEFNVTASNSAMAKPSDAIQASGNYGHSPRLPDPPITNTTHSDGQVLLTSAQINQEIYEAEAARNQGLISTAQYLKVLCTGLTKGSALLNREYEGLQRAIRGEDSRESIIRDAGFTEAESKAWFQEIDNIWNSRMVNGQRGEARRLRRAITRGQ